MDLIADLLLAIGAIGAGIYCVVLSRKINQFQSLDKGVGGAVAVLSSQVDELNNSMVTAKTVSEDSEQALAKMTDRAELIARRLELLMASMHDMPETAHTEPETPQEPAPKEPLSEDSGPVFVRHAPEQRKQSA